MRTTHQDSERKKQRIYDFIQAYQKEHGYPPSRRNIASALGISSLSVLTYQLRQMRDRGWIHYEDKVARSITLRRKGGDAGQQEEQ